MSSVNSKKKLQLDKMKPILKPMWEAFTLRHPILRLLFEGAKMFFQKKNKLTKEAEAKKKLEATNKHLKPKPPRPLPEKKSALENEAAKRIQQWVKPKIQPMLFSDGPQQPTLDSIRKLRKPRPEPTVARQCRNDRRPT